jgi:hypothetical protein
MSSRRKATAWLLICVSSLCSLTGCGSSGSSSAAAESAAPVSAREMAQPTAVNLYPSDSPDTGPQLFAMITAVGSLPANLPVILDTGSAGVTLNALKLFPGTLVGPSGFVFPLGESSIVYHGITITNQIATRSYGGANGTTQTGNVGFATLTIGDQPGTVTTLQMPVLLYYQTVETATGTVIDPSFFNGGILGINSSANANVVAGVAAPASGTPVCTTDSTGTCELISPFKFLIYATGLHAGFMLTPSPLQRCDISVAGQCQPIPMLTLGLTETMKAGFSTTSLVCPPPAPYNGPDNINGYPVCSPNIPSSVVTVSGAAAGSMIATLGFDTGTPGDTIRVAAGSTFPRSIPEGTDILWQTPSGFAYAYTANAGIYSTNITTVAMKLSGTIGIGFFTTNSLFTDFTSSTMGWK